MIELFKAGFQPVVVDNCSNSSIGEFLGQCGIQQKTNFILRTFLECLKRIEKIIGNPIVHYIVDCLHLDLLREIFRKHCFYAVVHCAALKSVGESVEKPIEYYRNNIGCLLNLLSVKIFDD